MTAGFASKRTEILLALEECGAQEDNDIDIGEAALLLAALDQPGVDLTIYREHLSEIADDVQHIAQNIGHKAIAKA